MVEMVPGAACLRGAANYLLGVFKADPKMAANNSSCVEVRCNHAFALCRPRIERVLPSQNLQNRVVRLREAAPGWDVMVTAQVSTRDGVWQELSACSETEPLETVKKIFISLNSFLQITLGGKCAGQ
jgi:hypothetical protein